MATLAPLAAVFLAVALPAQAQQGDIADMSLEELGNLRVTSAALRPERFLDTPASIFVITHEDIRRSGATSLMEALRLAPNLEVSRVSGTSYAISARGFHNVINNKMLVLVDGRALYTTVLSGVLWDAQDVMLEDIERIEVISGPGAALFGVNAFTGVINVISRSARDTRGTVVVAGGGRLSRDVAVRTGGGFGTDGAWRLYAMHNDRDNLRPAASGVTDEQRKTTIGFRADMGSGSDRMQVQGDAYDSTVRGNGAPEVKLKGANVLASWTRELGDDSRVIVRGYYDRAERHDPVGFADTVGTFDIEAQYDLRPWRSHRVSVGAGYRRAEDHVMPTAIVTFIPERRTLDWTSAFAQDEIRLGMDLTLTLGAKAQTGFYGGSEFLPDARVDWKPSKSALLWAAASKVARVPGRIDRDFFYPSKPPFLIQGGPEFRSERGRVYEVGYRASPSPRTTFSVAVFHQQLDRLRGGSLSPDGSGFVVSNEIEGSTTGLEAWALVQVADNWRVMAGWLELDQDLKPRAGSTDRNGAAALGNDPHHTVKLRSSWRVASAVDVDLDWRYVSKLSYLQTVPGYSSTNLRVAWRPTPGVELSVVGTDLFNKGHVEFDEHGFPARIPRAFYAQVRYQF